MAQEQHRGKGHAAYTESEAVDFVKGQGIAITSELAEEFGVSDVAIRKRLKQSDKINSRKVRNRRVWYVPHDPAEADGYGSKVAWGFPTAGIYPVFSDVGRVGGAISAALVVIALLIGFGNPVSLYLISTALLVGLISFAALYEALKFQDKADPTFGWSDAARSIRGRVK